MKPLTEMQRLIESGRFADWFYLRTGELATSKRGEKLRKRYLAGKPIMIVGKMRVDSLRIGVR